MNFYICGAMKKFLAFFVLISHMNTSMFLPQVPESDIYDTNGNQVDDINSLVEFVMVKFGLDHRADDEDDDSGQNFHIVKCVEYCFRPEFITVKRTDTLFTKTEVFAEYQEKVTRVSIDVIIPPPKNLA